MGKAGRQVGDSVVLRVAVEECSCVSDSRAGSSVGLRVGKDQLCVHAAMVRLCLWVDSRVLKNNACRRFRFLCADAHTPRR